MIGEENDGTGLLTSVDINVMTWASHFYGSFGLGEIHRSFENFETTKPPYNGLYPNVNTLSQSVSDDSVASWTMLLYYALKYYKSNMVPKNGNVAHTLVHVGCRHR